MEPEATDFKRISDEFFTRMDQIEKNLGANINKVADKVEEQDRLVKEKLETPAPKGDNDDDDLFFTGDKQKIKRIIQDEIKSSLSSFSQESERQKELERQEERYQRDCVEWDSKAYKEIPLLESNKDFSAEVTKELSTIPPLGKNKDGTAKLPPDAVYNAANRVLANWMREGRVNPMELNNMETIDYGRPTRKVKGEDVNDVQMTIARNLEISEDRAKEIYKPWNETGQKRFKREKEFPISKR